MHPSHYHLSNPRQSSQIYRGHQLPGSSRPSSFQRQLSPISPELDIKLITNAYHIINDNSNVQVHEYRLLVEPSSGCQEPPTRVLSRAFVSRSIRLLIMNTILPQLISEPVHAKGRILIEPNLETIFTLIRFPKTGGIVATGLEEYMFKNISVPTDLLGSLHVDISIKYARTFKLNSANCKSSLLSSVIHHQLLTDMLRYESVYYLSGDKPRQTMERLDLISQHLMGISISGARRSNDNQTLVVINCSHSYITQPHRLIDLLASYVECRPIANLRLHHDLSIPAFELQQIIHPRLTPITGDLDSFQTFCTILTGFKCRSHNFEGEVVNLRFHLTKQSANQLYLDEQTTVYDQYRSMGINLNYPNLPCLQSRSNKHLYYPFELCTLMQGQKVPVFRLSTQARTHLMSLNKPQPSLSWKNSVNARNQVASKNRDQFREFGLRLSTKPAEAVGSTLMKPMLQYRDRVLFPTRDFWESSSFYRSVDLVDNWTLVDTIELEDERKTIFLDGFIGLAAKFGIRMGLPARLNIPKVDIMERGVTIESIIERCSRIVRKDLKFIMFIIDANSTPLNRLIHLAFDDDPKLSATCIRAESILNSRQHRSIHRTLIHKLNSRLGGTNLTYSKATWERLSLECSDLMIIGLDVTHPDNELNGVSIVGCAYTYGKDLFRHKSLVWPQAARKEIIAKMDSLMGRLLCEYKSENNNMLPHQIIIYRDGVSHEEFERVRTMEISKAIKVLDDYARASNLPKPNLSYIIAQKRHTMRFFMQSENHSVQNPPGGTLIDQDIVPQEAREFYLYSNTSPQATARPLHYHVLLNGLGLENLQKLTYYLCFNFGKCSMSLSMPSSLRYAHNAAYDARNRVIASREFHENKFYTTKFFC